MRRWTVPGNCRQTAVRVHGSTLMRADRLTPCHTPRKHPPPWPPARLSPPVPMAPSSAC